VHHVRLNGLFTRHHVRLKGLVTKHHVRLKGLVTGHHIWMPLARIVDGTAVGAVADTVLAEALC
jgi:hypothetical protein